MISFKPPVVCKVKEATTGLWSEEQISSQERKDFTTKLFSKAVEDWIGQRGEGEGGWTRKGMSEDPVSV
jgi:hypothetical protein